jgi:hypothetical protein
MIQGVIITHRLKNRMKYGVNYMKRMPMKRAGWPGLPAALLSIACMINGTPAQASYIPNINPTPVGGETSLLGILNANAGTGSTYQQITGIPADKTTINQQVLFDVFQGNGPVTFTLLDQQAGHKAEHQFGFYTPITFDPIGSGPVYPAASSTFVIGGSSSGKPTAATNTITSEFGLIFYDPLNAAGQSPYNYFPSQSVWDPLGSDHHMAIFKDFTPSGVEIPNSFLIGVEDLHAGSDLDYNDFVVRVTIPEPATAGLFVLAGLLMLRKHRR